MEHSEHFVATAAPPVVAIGTGIIVRQVIPSEIVMPSSCLAVRRRSEAASSRLRTASHTTFSPRKKFAAVHPTVALLRSRTPPM